MLVAVENWNLFRDIENGAIDADADLAFLADVLELLAVLSLSTTGNRRHQLHPRAFRQLHQLVDNLAWLLLADGFATLWAVWASSTCVQKSEVVVDFSDSGDG